MKEGDAGVAATGIFRSSKADRQLFGGSFAFSQGIILRSLRPVTSTGWELSASYSRLKFFMPPSYSARHSLANCPLVISARIFFISALVCALTTREPRVRSPYSAVLLML